MFYRLLPFLSGFQFPSFSFWNQTILLSLEADIIATVSSYQPHKSWYHASLYLLLLLNTSIPGKALLSSWHFSYIPLEQYMKVKLLLGFTPLLCTLHLWNLLAMETCSTSYSAIWKGVSPSLRVFFSAKSSISLSGFTRNKGGITKINYYHCLYSNLPDFVFPACFPFGFKCSTLRCIFLACSLGLCSQTGERAVSGRWQGQLPIRRAPANSFWEASSHICTCTF